MATWLASKPASGPTRSPPPPATSRSPAPYFTRADRFTPFAGVNCSPTSAFRSAPHGAVTMEDEKLSGRVIIDTILSNMRQEVEELRYSRVVPAAYDVYLHADDQRRFEGLAHEIAAEAVRALEERLEALNRPSRMDRVRE